jgi:hypothetical protein
MSSQKQIKRKKSRVILFCLCNDEKSVNDRYYRALYATLFRSDIFRSSRQSLYLNLLYKVH